MRNGSCYERCFESEWGDIRVEAADLSEGMVGCLREGLEDEGLKGKVGISVTDAQV